MGEGYFYLGSIQIGTARECRLFPTRGRAAGWIREMEELARAEELTAMRGLPVSGARVDAIPAHKVPQGAIPWDVTQDWEVER